MLHREIAGQDGDPAAVFQNALPATDILEVMEQLCHAPVVLLVLSEIAQLHKGALRWLIMVIVMEMLVVVIIVVSQTVEGADPGLGLLHGGGTQALFGATSGHENKLAIILERHLLNVSNQQVPHGLRLRHVINLVVVEGFLEELVPSSCPLARVVDEF
jgi:hypothetical protein